MTWEGITARLAARGERRLARFYSRYLSLGRKWQLRALARSLYQTCVCLARLLGL